jgi:hypothetical protein
MEQVRSIVRSIALALCCSLVSVPVWAKTFVGVLYPLFGPVAAIGLVQLASELKAMPDVEVATYLHQSWRSLVDDINRQPKGTRILIVGYSLGANNAILVANNTGYVDSIIALQPSMLTKQDSLTGKVGKIVEIYNPNPWMTFGGMGSQKLDAPNIEYIVNNDTHPGAQFSDQFRSVARNEVARLAALDSAQAKLAKPSQLVKLMPPKEPQPSHLAFASEETPKRDQTTHAAIRHEQTITEQTKQQQKPQSAFADAPKLQTVSTTPAPMLQSPVADGPRPVFADAPKLQTVAITTPTQPAFADAPKLQTFSTTPPPMLQPALAVRPPPQPVYADALSSSATADNSFVQRTLTFDDMKDYVKRNYPRPQTADSIR